jgi:uncharacterized caspase-like protein
MADDREFVLSLSAGGSSTQTSGGVEYSLQPCNQADESVHKKKKASTASLDGCAPKRRGEEASEQEPRRAVDSQLTVLEGEEGDDSDYEEFMVGLSASYAANVQKMIANNPFIWTSYGVRHPGVELPNPCTSRSDGQNDAAKEDEELVGAVVTPPASG